MNIVLIGVGGIGFRHFQSLMNLEHDKINLFLIDVNAEALNKAKEFEKSKHNKFINIVCYENINHLKEAIDIAIIATSSLVRKKIFEQLISTVSIKYVIFEKFLFPQICDYDEVNQIIEKNGIKAYVNCPCRMYPGYIELKKRINPNDRLDVLLYGSNWGLACNVIHTIDVMGFLLDTYDELTVDTSLLDEEIIESKRNGYVEFTGKLICEIGEKVRILFDSEKTGESDYCLTLFCKNSIITISEMNQTMKISQNGSTQVYEFPIFYQSQLTDKIVLEIIKEGKCGLTKYKDTVQWHKTLLEAFSLKYSIKDSSKTGYCPIT